MCNSFFRGRDQEQWPSELSARKIGLSGCGPISRQCATAANIYQAFINELQAQSGKGVSASAAAIMIADAQYLITHCP
jgi:hypothetical protein